MTRASALFVLAIGAGIPASAFAQAWVPPAGIGIVTVVYQSIDNTDHRAADGTLIPGFESVSRGMLVNLDYAVTDRFSFSVGFPYIASKYTGSEPSFFGLPIDECRCWNHGWQDVNASARYNIVNAAFGLTSSVSFGVPSHDYDSIGEAALGRNLRELRLAVDAGRRLDAIWNRLSVSGRYSFAFVEQADDVSSNRSNISFEVGVLASRKMSTNVAFSWQRTHGGIRSTEFNDQNFLLFDRVLKDNNFQIGGGVAYSLPRFDVFTSFTHYASGTDTHAGRAITAGVSLPFEK